ncbi:MAG: Zn-dependent protease [Bdellovibrionaceae bacterium]|nr:Zn-dependent protease [Pseudobdellovibrionaceae bacterium]
MSMKNSYLEKTIRSFHHCADWIFLNSPSGASATVSLDAESSLFVRFNNHRVRQNIQVEQATAKILLTWQQKSYRFSFSITNHPDEDLKKIKVPFLKIIKDWDNLLSENVDFKITPKQSSSSYLWSEHNPNHILDFVAKATSHVDFTGLMTIGPVLSCVRNSNGVSHEFLTELVTIDYSLYDGPRAAKGLYSSRDWNEHKFMQQLRQTQSLLEMMKKPKVELTPDTYRVYLGPGAVSEMAQMLNWGAVSQRSYRLGRNPLKRLIEKETELSPLFSVSEDFSLGMGPQFNSLGEKSPPLIPIIQKGNLMNLFTSTKSAIEFSVESNLAEEDEGFRSMSIDTGALKREDILPALGTGIFISNLHYLNWSNPMDARITGMTRYACFWVEKGQIQGPIVDLRFDDTLFDLWGQELEAVTDFSELEPQTTTYFQRHLGGKRVPGMLIKKMKFTL